MPIISINNRKGGVGKSTTAATLSDITARFDKKVLLLSADSQNDSGKLLGVFLEDYNDDKDSFPDLQDFIENNRKIDDCCVKISENLDIVFTKSLKRLNKAIDNISRVESLLEEKFKDLNKQYDYIYVDTAPSDSLINDYLIGFSDFIVMPVETSFLAKDAVGKMFSYLTDLRIPIDNIKYVIPNKMRKNVKKHVENYNDIVELFSEKNTYVSEPIPLRADIEAAAEEGVSLIEYHKETGMIFIEIAKKILGIGG